jgi:ubiquinone/menaquinone biosynthesis C-methylase UbiE
MTGQASNTSFYDADSATYDQQRWTSVSGSWTNQVQQGIVADLCGDWRGQRVLEVGPGTARFTIPLARAGNRMTLLDIAAKMLDQARANLEAAGAAGQVDAYCQGSIYELPFDDGSFDHALTLNVLNHLERTGDAIGELARVVKPGATILFNYANLHSYYWPAARRINARRTAVGQDVLSRWERPGDMRRAIERAGLVLVRRAGHVHVPRGMERLGLRRLVAMMDRLSRRGPLAGLAPVHFCLCRKRDGARR